jgi:serine protease
MRRSHLLMCLGLAVLTNTLAASKELNPVRNHSSEQREPAVQRIIVKLRAFGPGSAASAAAEPAALAQRAGLTLRDSHQIALGLHVMRVQPAVGGESLAATLARLRADSAVQYAEPDQRRYPQAVSDDPLFSGQWYLQSASATPSAVDAESAWSVTTGSTGIVIADIDTGVRFDHPDLLRAAAGDAGRLLPGYDFVSGLNSANDGDGRDADASDPGDWISMADTNTAEFSDCVVEDSSWHGTRVVGILGAITNNATGIAGLTWSSWILPVRALGKCGGSDSDIEAAMLWAGGIHVDGVPDNPHPANIENLSIGAAGSCPQSYQEVIGTLTARGVLIVVSAGNAGGPVSAPANCPGVAAIAGLRHAGTKVGFSNLGPEIALGAPAGNCVNTTAGSPCVYSLNTTYNLGTTTPTTSGYTDQTITNLGTSFSAPIVSGIAALMLAVNGNLKSTELIARLQEGAKPFPQTSLGASGAQPPACHVPSGPNDNTQDVECICTLDDMTCGAGMANASGAVAAALRPIAAVAVPMGVTPGANVTLQGAGSAAACHHAVSTYAWSIVSGSASGISGANTSTAVVVAPSAGSFTVRLTVTDDAGRQDTANVAVSSNAATTTAESTAGAKACLSAVAIASPVGVSVSPASAILKVGAGTQAFKATVTDTTNTAVTWQVNQVTGGNASVGTISATGVYTPPATLSAPLSVTVTAVSVAVKTQAGSARVTVTTAPASSSAGASSGGGGGGGAIDLLTLLVLLCARARRLRSLFLTLRHLLRGIEPFFLRPAVVRRRNTRLL